MSSEWISVNDRLPEYGILVLTYDSLAKEYRLDYIILNPNGEEPYIWANSIVTDWDKTSHWMPLPPYHQRTIMSDEQRCRFCLNPESILTPETCCTGCSALNHDMPIIFNEEKEQEMKDNDN